MTTILIALAAVCVLAATFGLGYLSTPLIQFLVNKYTKKIIRDDIGQPAQEVTFEIPTVDGEAPKFDSLPDHIRRVIGSREKYEDAVAVANQKRAQAQYDNDIC